MKVLQLLSSLNHDESERGIYPLTHALNKQGHDSLVVASAPLDNELVTKLERDGSDYYRLDMPKKSWWSLRHVPKLIRLLNTEKPDIVHVHARTPAWVLHWALRYSQHTPKVVGTMYGFYALNSYSRGLFYSDVLITASKSIDRYLKDELAELDDTSKLPEIHCIRRGVDARIYPYRHKPSVHWLQHVFAEFPELEHKKWLIFPTAIGADQGQEWLIDVLGNLTQKHPDAHVIIMDEENFDQAQDPCSVTTLAYEDFHQRTKALGLDHKISFVGRRPADLRDWLSAAHVVLALANRPESIGMNALKAIHLGTPVIGWDKGAFSDILTALYPRGLIKETTAKALYQSVASQLETGIRPTITHDYEVEKMVEETLALYQTLLKNP